MQSHDNCLLCQESGLSRPEVECSQLLPHFLGMNSLPSLVGGQWWCCAWIVVPYTIQAWQGGIAIYLCPSTWSSSVVVELSLGQHVIGTMCLNPQTCNLQGYPSGLMAGLLGCWFSGAIHLHHCCHTSGWLACVGKLILPRWGSGKPFMRWPVFWAISKSNALCSALPCFRPWYSLVWGRGLINCPHLNNCWLHCPWYLFG